jgi:hypothetical protein
MKPEKLQQEIKTSPKNPKVILKSYHKKYQKSHITPEIEETLYTYVETKDYLKLTPLNFS